MNYKRLLIGALLLPFGLYAQEKQHVRKPNWYNLDLQKDSVFGTSINRANQELLKGKKTVPVIVALIDGGMDIQHVDLKAVVWKNAREFPGNGKDDDRNGYIDDVSGWNFLGSSKGSFEYDNDQIIRQIRADEPRFKGKDSTTVAAADLPAFSNYRDRLSEVQQKLKKLNERIENSTKLLADYESVLKQMGKANPTVADFKSFVPVNADQARFQLFIVNALRKSPDLKAYIDQAKSELANDQLDARYHLNIDYDPRAAAAAEFAKEQYYGNNDVKGPVPPAHGTHVAGVLGAVRGNGIGIDGVADAVRLMPIRTIPDGDAREKDVANAIRYAADNGARIINMSFGFSAAHDAARIKSAVIYALAKDILFIQAAGNGGDNLDLSTGYPDRKNRSDDDFTKCFIKVGASGFLDNDTLAFRFSNYGKTTVDVFAPGVDINSTVPDNKYEVHTGTSMAAPVVSGVAALIRANYPKLTASQLKEILMKSVMKRDALKDKCISGGVINAYHALTLAATYK